jgi:ketosteroid isomerase-like protein
VTRDNAEWVRCFYDAWNRRDWEWVAAMLSPRVEWFNAARGEQVRGVDDVVAMLRSVADAFPSAFVKVRSVHDAGETIVAEAGFVHGARAKAKVSPAMSVQEATFCEVIELEKGRCVRGSTYADTLRLLLDTRKRVALKGDPWRRSTNRAPGKRALARHAAPNDQPLGGSAFGGSATAGSAGAAPAAPSTALN